MQTYYVVTPDVPADPKLGFPTIPGFTTKVEAENVQVTANGDAVFMNAKNSPVLLMAVGTWQTIFPRNEIHCISMPLDDNDNPGAIVFKNTQKAKS